MSWRQITETDGSSARRISKLILTEIEDKGFSFLLAYSTDVASANL